MTPVLRFAAAPTGFLHIGHARIALVSFLLARRIGARFILRLDDSEPERVRQNFADAIQQDLRWLGITRDEISRQSDHPDRYTQAAERLKTSGRLYPCFESEEELSAKRDHRLRRRQSPVYDRAMLRLTPEQRAAAEAHGKRPYWRFLLSPATITWDDLVLGRQEIKLPTMSDPVLIRADGIFLPTFASVVDDITDGITHLVRSEDQLTNTAAQLDLLGALGGNPRRVSLAHLPPLAEPGGEKRARRLESLTLRALRNDGIEPAAIATYLATPGAAEPLDMAALAARFDFSRVQKTVTPFDISRVLALNRRVLKKLAFADVAERLPSGATEVFWHAIRGHLDLLTEARLWWDVVAGTIAPPILDGEQLLFRTALDLLPPEPWGPSGETDVWTVWTVALQRKTGRTTDDLAMNLRLALTGEDHGPDLPDLLPLIGRARAAERLRLAAG